MGIILNQKDSVTKMIESIKEEIDNVISVTLTSEGFKFEINPNYIRDRVKKYKLNHPTDGRTIMTLTQLIDDILNGEDT